MDKLELLMEWVYDTEPSLHDICMELEGDYSDLKLSLDDFIERFNDAYPIEGSNYV